MQKIAKKEYQEAIGYLHGHKDANHRVYLFDTCDLIVGNDGRFVYVADRSEDRVKYYRENSETVISFYFALRTLYLKEVMIMKGFYDRSYNSSLYEPIIECEFSFGPLSFTYSQIREMTYSIEKAKYTYKK